MCVRERVCVCVCVCVRESVYVCVICESMCVCCLSVGLCSGPHSSDRVCDGGSEAGLSHRRTQITHSRRSRGPQGTLTHTSVMCPGEESFSNKAATNRSTRINLRKPCLSAESSV